MNNKNLTPDWIKDPLAQATLFVIASFINSYFLQFNFNWIFGIQVPAIYHVILSFATTRLGWRFALVGVSLQAANVAFPIIPV